LFGGIAAAAGAMLARVAQPDPAAATNGQPVLAGQQNTATLSTQVLTENGVGVLGRTENHAFSGVAGLVGAGVHFPNPPDVDAGVFGLGGGLGETTAGVWGDAPNGVGVIGTGPWGVYGTGGVAVAGDAGIGSTGVYGFVGLGSIPMPTPGVGVEARADVDDLVALNVVGRATFNRSGRAEFQPGQTVLTIQLSGVSRRSLVMAVPQTFQSGVYLAAAAPFTNLFVLRLSKAPTIPYFVSWLVLN
jgi:hypothetical protein